jgi:diadenosine tetraphosphate (Ap4A) HIT family hydrolase
MIHPQLLQDCHHLGAMPSAQLLLQRNASLPWFILVPETGLEDVLDLDTVALSGVLADCQQVSRFLKRELALAKVNFAGLGNVVPQMHLHVIGRSVEDSCWPQPVWGNLSAEAAYPATTLSAWQALLREKYGLLEP